MIRESKLSLDIKRILTPPAVSCKPAKAGLVELSNPRKTPGTFFYSQVYEFVSDPENLPKWAAGLSGSIKKDNDDWITKSPMGTVKVKFAEKNKSGILDHEVTLPSGVKVYNPLRVFPNNDGSELVFTLHRRPDVSDQEFAEDANSVEKDLAKLKTLLEK